MAFVVASTAVRDLVRGEGRPARVVAVLPAAVYLTADHLTTGPPGRLIALLARDAVRVPLGLVTAAPRREAPFAGVRPGDRAVVGDGVLRLERGGPYEGFRPLRYWDPRVPRLRAGLTTAQVRHRADALAALAAGLPPSVVDHWLQAVAPLGAALAALPGAAPPGLPAGPPTGPPAGLPTGLPPGLPGGRDAAFGDLAAAVRGLAGLGPGLTPAGDDVLAGALVALAAAGDEPRRAALAAALEPALPRTTPVSAALLEQACLGRTVPEVSGLLRALAGSADLDAALAALAAVGHTSGTALALGVRLALRAVDRHDLGRAA